MSETPGTAEAPAVAVLLTQAAHAEALAAVCAMAKVPVDALPTPIGAVAVCRDTSAGAPEQAAAGVSRLLRGTPVVLLTHRAGRMTAARWTDGSAAGELSPALMLDGAPAEVEQLLLGQVRVGELAGVVSSEGMSRWRAVRVLGASARAAGKIRR